MGNRNRLTSVELAYSSILHEKIVLACSLVWISVEDSFWKSYLWDAMLASNMVIFPYGLKYSSPKNPGCKNVDIVRM